MIRKILFLFVAVPLLASCDQVADFAALQDADFFECEPNNTLVVCKVGTGPPAGMACAAVGSGSTTIEPRAC